MVQQWRLFWANWRPFTGSCGAPLRTVVGRTAVSVPATRGFPMQLGATMLIRESGTVLTTAQSGDCPRALRGGDALMSVPVRCVRARSPPHDARTR